MSTEEDTELRDLLQQTLEHNGSLAKIRAQLRACVFMAFDEDDKIQAKQPLMNNKIKSQLEEPEGQLLFALVHEFLEYYNMDYTLSVFKSESYLDTAYAYRGRNKLLKELQLHENESVPILLQLLKSFTSSAGFNVSKTNGFNGSLDEEHAKVPLLNRTYDVPENDSKNNTPRSAASEGKDDTYEGTSSIAEDSINMKEKSSISTEKNQDFDECGDKSAVNGLNSPGKLDLLDKYDHLNSKSDKTEKSTTKSSTDKFKSKSPRSNLPEISSPLQTNKSPRNSDFVLPSLYNSNQGYDDNLDNYEEDFMSTSDVDVQNDKSHHSVHDGLISSTKLESLKLKSERFAEKSEKSSATSDDFELNSTVDDILKSNSN